MACSKLVITRLRLLRALLSCYVRKRTIVNFLNGGPKTYEVFTPGLKHTKHRIACFNDSLRNITCTNLYVSTHCIII